MSSVTAPRCLAVVLLAALCVISRAAIAEELAGSGIRKLIGGELVRLNTPLGISLPLRYRNDGALVGDISGISAARMFAPKEEGRWWVENDALCQQWPTWYKGRQFCFKIRLLGQGKIAWLRDDGASGTARIGE